MGGSHSANCCIVATSACAIAFSLIGLETSSWCLPNNMSRFSGSSNATGICGLTAQGWKFRCRAQQKNGPHENAVGRGRQRKGAQRIRTCQRGGE